MYRPPAHNSGKVPNEKQQIVALTTPTTIGYSVYHRLTEKFCFILVWLRITAHSRFILPFSNVILTLLTVEHSER